MLPTMFSTRHALPLTFVRFSRPRISRAHYANCPRNRRGEAPNIGHGLVLSSDVSQPQPRTRQSLDQTMNTATPQPRPCPWSARVQHGGSNLDAHHWRANDRDRVRPLHVEHLLKVRVRRERAEAAGNAACSEPNDRQDGWSGRDELGNGQGAISI